MSGAGPWSPARWPIRVRLTAAFAVTLALLLVGLGVFVRARSRADATAGIDRELRNRAAASVAGRDANRQLRRDLLGLTDEHYGQELDADGRVVAASVQLGRRPIVDLPPGIHDAVVRTRREPRASRVLVAPRDGRTLVLATAVDDRDEAIYNLSRLLVISGGLTLAVGTLLAWWLAGAALRPVDRLRAVADTFSARDLSLRLDEPGPDDEIRRLAETLNAMLDRIQVSFEGQRRFVDRASHELRTPLANLSLELELALRRPRSADELRTALESAASETHRLESLASNLLALARSGDGVLPVVRTPTDLGELIEATVATFRARADAAGVAIDVAVDPMHPRSIDPVRVRQALTNLLDNALRVAPSGSAVTVAADDSDGRIRIAVTDHGPGFGDLETTGEAFAVFSRGEHASAGGAGLGLAIVAAIAEAHDGSAAAATTVTSTTVTITLR